MHMTESPAPKIEQYFLCGVPLASVSANPYLGVQLHETFSWNTHIDYVSNEASRVLGLLRRNIDACMHQN